MTGTNSHWKADGGGDTIAMDLLDSGNRIGRIERDRVGGGWRALRYIRGEWQPTEAQLFDSMPPAFAWIDEGMLNGPQEPLGEMTEGQP